MAEGGSVDGVNSNKDSSEEDGTLDCTTCKGEGNVVEGVAYCVQCSEYLCQDCFKWDRRSKALKEHRILEGTDMQDVNKVTLCVETQRDNCCIRHQGKSLEYYCPTHKELICSVCKDVSHKQCTQVENIDVLVRHIKFRQGASRFQCEMTSLIETLQRLKAKRQEDLTYLREQKVTALEEINTIRTNINIVLDRVVDEITEGEEGVFHDETRMAQNHISSLADVIDTLQKNLNSFNTIHSAGSDRQLFIAMARIDIKAMQHFYMGIELERNRAKILLVKEQHFNALLQQIKDLGVHPTKQACFNQPAGCLKDWEVQHIADHRIECDKSNYNCCITAMTFTFHGQLLVCDSKHQKIILLDDEINLLSSLTVSNSPNDIAITGEQEAVVTIGITNMLQFITLAPKMMLGRTLKVDGKVHGLAFHKEHLYIMCSDRIQSVLIYDLGGCIKKRLSFRNLSYGGFLVLDSEDRIYISSSCNINCLSPEGETIYNYGHQDYQYRKPLVDREQYVFLCPNDGRIQIVSPSGKLHKYLSVERASGPMAYRSRDNKIVFADNSKSNQIRIYQFI